MLYMCVCVLAHRAFLKIFKSYQPLTGETSHAIFLGHSENVATWQQLAVVGKWLSLYMCPSLFSAPQSPPLLIVSHLAHGTHLYYLSGSGGHLNFETLDKVLEKRDTVLKGGAKF